MMLQQYLEVEVLQDALAVHGLLRQEPSRREHRKPSVLQLLSDHDVQLLLVIRLQAERIEADVAWVVIVPQQSWLIVRSVRRIHPADLRALRLSRADERDDQGIPSVRHLREVRDGRTRDLRVEQERAALHGLANEETNDGEHGHAAVRHFCLAVCLIKRGMRNYSNNVNLDHSNSIDELTFLKGPLVRVRSESGGVEKSDRRKGAGHVVDGERVQGARGPGRGGGGEGGGGAEEEGGDGKVHHYCRDGCEGKCVTNFQFKKLWFECNASDVDKDLYLLSVSVSLTIISV